jgi:DNA gyrase/topoisomerase IV subunit B
MRTRRIRDNLKCNRRGKRRARRYYLTRYEDKSIEVEDFGRGCPMDWNQKEKRYNWELVFCEMYAGGKYKNDGENYEFPRPKRTRHLRHPICLRVYAVIRRDGQKYKMHFEKGEEQLTSPRTEKRQAPPSAGNQISTYSPTSTFQWNISRTSCAARPW